MTIIRLRNNTDGQQFRISLPQQQDLNISQLSELLKAQLPNQSTLQSISIGNEPKSVRCFPPSALLSQLGIGHGSMLYFTANYSQSSSSADSTAPSLPESSAGVTHGAWMRGSLDGDLFGDAGLIRREKSSLCRHGANGMCDNCMPLQPFNAGYLQELKIKYLSFHAYLKQLFQSMSKLPPLSEVSKSLSEPSYTVQVPCSTGHAPYPQAMCAKCQPSAITLQSQTYRMVDHVEFVSSQSVDCFIDAWRQSGLQRFGYLLGRYERYGEVPLGVKAVVSHIYEPAQINASDGCQLMESIVSNGADHKNESSVPLKCLEVAKMMGLELVGMIYTDLTHIAQTPEDIASGLGSVMYKRNKDTFFLSGTEICFIARHQSAMPYLLPDGQRFSSRFVTVVVSGDEKRNIGLSAYQISTQCQSLIRDEIIDATTNPMKMSVRESSPSQYIPDVFHKYKNSYGVVVQESARPFFPTDYFIVSLTEGFRVDADTSSKSKLSQFAVENRIDSGLSSNSSYKWDFSGASRYLSAVGVRQALEDFHFLFYLSQCGFFSLDDLKGIMRVVKEQGEAGLEGVEQWLNFKAVLRESSSVSQSNSVGSSSKQQQQQQEWACRHCTYLNNGRSDCEMCGLPR